MQRDIFVELDSASGKTSQEYSASTAGEILLKWLGQWLGQNSVYQKLDGKQPELLSDETDSSSGACWTRSMSEHDDTLPLSLRDGGVCTLSSILETGPVDRRYYLTPKACAGILRRAEKRGKKLPTALHLALTQVADGSSSNDDRNLCGTPLPPEAANPLTARMHKGINTTADEGQTAIPIVFTQNIRGMSSDVTNQPENSSRRLQVRVLTAEECELLMGFPRGFTRISWRGKKPENCPTGLRYKALGNSMAVNCMEWVGLRIELVGQPISHHTN